MRLHPPPEMPSHLLACLLLSALAIAALMFMRFLAREHPTSVPKHLPEPPDDASPALAYGLAHEGGDSTDTVLATLLDLVERGYYDAKTEGSDDEKLDLALKKASKRPSAEKLEPHEKEVLSFFDELLGDETLAMSQMKDKIPEHDATWRGRWETMTSALDSVDEGHLTWDRSLNGTFPLWSILKNLSIASLRDISAAGMVDRAKETELGAQWKKRIEIRTPDMGNKILSLSGGNQQKVLFARALATTASTVLMDDPMRGVDIGTKQEVYDILRTEASHGRTFIWYSTEMDEIRLCDRVYVFRDGAIQAELVGDDITEQNVLAASFAGEDHA